MKRQTVFEFMLGGTLGACGALALLIWFCGPLYAHSRWCSRVGNDLASLAHRRPQGVSQGEWEWIVGWTTNLHANCGNVGQRVERRWRDEFEAELERRLKRPLAIADIEWVWDQYALHTPYGKKYSGQWRPTRPENLRQAHEGCFGISVD